MHMQRERKGATLNFTLLYSGVIDTCYGLSLRYIEAFSCA